MRMTAFLLLLILPFCVMFAQQGSQTGKPPVDPDTKLFKYQEVVNQDGTKDILFERGMAWMRVFYVNPNSVANVMDKANGKIEGIGRLRVYYFDKDSTKLDGGIVTYALRLEFKENKFRYTLNDFNLKTISRYPIERWMNPKDPDYTPRCDSYLYQVDTVMQRLVRMLKEEMKPKTQKKDEW
ncbi:MAG: DUF4468 domain-containing protein [Bacteroidetes bacterium]|nr:DUF4468 domain-containing protein [Bacteroidota bacterium]